MKNFAELFTALDRTTKTTVKVNAMADFFALASDEDKLWTIALLSHRRPRRTVNTTLLRQWAADAAGIPLWLFEEAYPVVGDLAETIALVLPEHGDSADVSLSEWIRLIVGLRDVDENARKEAVVDAWKRLNRIECFLFNKLITGGFRVGVSQKLMSRALSKATGIDEAVVAHRLMGDWSPLTTTFDDLVLSSEGNENQSRPYPFCLAYAVEGDVRELGDTGDWMAERKWDGIRGQLIVRGGEVFLWSRGEELVTDRFPEFHDLAGQMPDGIVLDGEILPWREGKPMDFQSLQTRIGRKTVGKKLLKDAPVILMAYDVMEDAGKDIRDLPFEERRNRLERIITTTETEVLQLSPLLKCSDWQALAAERENSRAHASEGLMLKRKDSIYHTGRRKGDWFKWKIDPMTVDAVMIYAQRGHGRRANLYTDFTFAVWNKDELVPFTKAYSGLTDTEFNEITNWVRRNTLERFGPVRRVAPDLVFEIAFEGIQKSKRHKSGIALRFPRMKRWRRDKPPIEAGTIEELHSFLNAIAK
ncbi:MAG: ATP-dependent DNA ligase [Pseudomonadota bacterium]